MAQRDEHKSESYTAIANAAAAAGFDMDWKPDRSGDRRVSCDLTGRTSTWPAWNPWVRRKTPYFGLAKNLVFGVVLVPLRLVLMIATFLLLWLWLSIAVIGADTSKPMASWRRRIMRGPIKFACRTQLFICGFYWVNDTYIKLPDGSPAAPPASIVLSNHTGYIEILYTAACYGCCFVAKSVLANQPIFGRIMKCGQCIFVDRESGTSHAGAQIIERAKHADSWPMLALYPEGTTTNGRQLISFHTGAFIAGAPVIPLVIKYQSWMFDPSFTCTSQVTHMLKMLSQPVNFMQVIHLPTYVPSAAEKQDPHLYANNVRSLMSVVGQLPTYDLEWAEKLEFEPPRKRDASIRLLRQRQGAKKAGGATQTGAASEGKEGGVRRRRK